MIGGLLVGAPIGIAAHGLARDRGAGVPRPTGVGSVIGHLVLPQLGLVLAISLLASVGGLRADRIPLSSVPGIDKVLHLLLFGLLAFFATFARVGHRSVGPRLAVALPCAIACAEEGLQAVSPWRTVDALDLACDLLGVLLGVALGKWLASRGRPSRPGEPVASHAGRVQTSRPECP